MQLYNMVSVGGLHSNYASAYLIRGSARRMLADKNEACADLRKALELGDKRAIEFINEYCIGPQ